MLKLSGLQLKNESSRPILGDTFSYQRDRPRINTLWDQRKVALAAGLRGGDADARAGGALRGLVDGGFAWVDDQAPARAYYFPSVWLDARQKLAAG